MYVPKGACCELQPGDIDAWLESILGTAQTDYPEDVPWWITVEGDGQITRIEQQFLPLAAVPERAPVVAATLDGRLRIGGEGRRRSSSRPPASTGPPRPPRPRPTRTPRTPPARPGARPPIP